MSKRKVIKKNNLNLRKVLFTDGMSNDFLLILTDAPVKEIKAWVRNHNAEMENNENTYLDSLKVTYFVRVLLDSEVDEYDRDCIMAIGYDESYDFSYYYNMQTKCNWTCCKFNHGGLCTAEVYPASITQYNYRDIWNENSKEVKENCRSLTFDMAQYREQYDKFVQDTDSTMSMEEWFFTYLKSDEPELLEKAKKNAMEEK